MKQFDDIFREKVKEAFGRYNADHLADKGWNSLISRKKDRRWLLLMLPLWAKAASVAVIIGLGSFFGYQILTRQSGQEITVVAPVKDKEIKSAIPGIKIPEIEMPEAKKGTNLPAIAKVSEPVREAVHTEQSAPGTRESLPVSKELPASTDSFLKENAFEQLKLQMPFLAERRIHVPDDSINSAASVASKLFKVEQIQTDPEPEPEKRSGKTTLMAGFSGLLAQADEASSSSHGIALGFYLDQKITDRISLRPGLVMSRNSFGIDNRGGVNESSYLVPLNDGTSGRVDSYNGHFDMIAMEMPLNFVFKISGRQRSGLYLSAGASTMIYISQKFTGDFVNEYTKMSYYAELNAFASETRYSKVEVENHYGAFSRTDFFRLINLSAGYSLPYGKTGTLIIEPFLQLPVDDLTSLDLRVRYGGISMKIRFGKEEAKLPE